MKLKFILTLPVLLFFSLYSFGQTVIDSEDFSGGSTGWTLTSTGAGTNIWWVNSLTSVLGTTVINGTSTSGGNFLHVGSAGTGEPGYFTNDAGTCDAISPAFVTTGYSNVDLTFEWISNGDVFEDDDYGDAYYSTDGGTIWNKLNAPTASTHYYGITTGLWQTITFDAATMSNAFDNKASILLKFTWVNPSSLSGTDPPFCIDDIRFTIPGSVPSPMVASKVDSTNISCFGDGTGSATVSVSGGTPGYTYLWKNGGGGTVGTNDSTLTGVGGDTYSVQITDAGTGDTTIYFTIEEPTDLSLPTPSPINGVTCFGDMDGSAVFAGAGGTTPYSYSVDGITYSATTTISGLSGGAHKVYVKDGNGCVDSVTFSVPEPTAVVLDTVSTSPSSCYYSGNGSATVTFSTTASGTINYSFDGGTTWGGSTTNSMLSGNILAIAEDGDGCRDSISFVIGGANPIVVDMGSDITVCDGDSASFGYSITGPGTLPYTINWNNTADITVNETTKTVDITPTGNYILTLVATDSTGCPSNTDSIMVTTNPLPDIQLDSEFTIIPGTSANLVITSALGTTFEWSPASGLDIVNASTVTASPTSTTTYTVVVTTAEGCMDTAEVLVNVADAFTIFSSFTPNGDGINDTWVISGIEQYPTAEVEIFNRWGTVVYEKQTNYATNPWDGTHKNSGDQLSGGTYYYIITIESNGDVYKGAVELLK